MENGGANMEPRNNKTNKLEEIQRLSYEIRTNFTMPQYSHTFIHVRFVRNSYDFRMNFTSILSNLPINKATQKQAHLAITWACD